MINQTINTINNAYKPTILVIDDLPENLKLLAELLKSKNYIVKVSLSGELALKSLEKITPDLILLDIKMPNLDGYEVCTRLKINPKTANVPVIFLSALDTTFDKVKAFKVGCADYVTKPFQVEEVVSRIENQLTIQRQKKILIEEIQYRQKIELNLQTTNEELVKKTQQLEIVNQDLEAFNYSVAHDLRNPLTTIITVNSLLKNFYSNQLDDQGQELLQLIEKSSQQMDEIIKDLLTLTTLREQELNIKTFDLSETITEILTQLQTRQLDKKVNLIIAPNIKLEADQGLLKIALENLLGNAWKYSSKQENPCIEFGVMAFKNLANQEEAFSIQYPHLSLAQIQQQNGENLVYFIKDNGAGFDMNKAAQIFLPFKRLHSDNEFEGTGIGLSIVKRIINRHNGFIWCESKVNEGSIFYFNFLPKALN